MLHLTPNQPSACPESGTLGTVVRQDVRHNKRPAHTDWRNTDGWDLGGFPLGLRHMSGAEGPLGTPVQHCHSSLIESLIGQGNHMTNQEKILHSYYTTAMNRSLWSPDGSSVASSSKSRFQRRRRLAAVAAMGTRDMCVYCTGLGPFSCAPRIFKIFPWQC